MITPGKTDQGRRLSKKDIPYEPCISKINTQSHRFYGGASLPRQCGIATFTTDLCEAIATQYKQTNCIALPVNDTEAGYTYPPRVRF